MALYKIRYKGLSDVRQMSQKDLKDAGVLGIGGDLEWSAKNQKTVYVENMSKSLESILRTEGTFTISEVDERGDDITVVMDGEALDDTTRSNVVTDQTTGQSAKAK